MDRKHPNSGRNLPREIMAVTGRADICVILTGPIDETNNTVIEFKKTGDRDYRDADRGGGQPGTVRAIVPVKPPKKLIAARLRRVRTVLSSFPTGGQFDAVAIIGVGQLSEIKDVTTEIQKIGGVERTGTLVEVQ